MKAEYLRHEYTWSNHCITGNALGWGITASSLPQEKRILKELEKIASGARPDRENQIPVEELVYDPVCGFVKLVVTPCEAGEDHRKNKLVRIFQPSPSSENKEKPECYLAPGDVWKKADKEGYLTPQVSDELQVDVNKTLIEMNLYDRLPDFLQAVFWSMSEEIPGLNIVAPDWKEEDFSQNARKLMYVIHFFLPEALRKKAGYLSWTDREETTVPFCFSKTICASNYLCLYHSKTTLLELGIDENSANSHFSSNEQEKDALDSYFSYYMAECYIKKEALFQKFYQKAGEYFQKNSKTGNTLKKLQWLFYGLCMEENREMLDKEYLMHALPELFYWTIRDSMLESTVDLIVDKLHATRWKTMESTSYVTILLEGFTGRTQERIGEELHWILQKIYKQNKKLLFQQMEWIQEKNPVIYTQLLCEYYEEKNSYAKEIFEQSLGSFEGMEHLFVHLQKGKMPSEMKDQVMVAGIHLLNEDLFCKQSFVSFDSIIQEMERTRQWAEILKDFVGQLLEETPVLDESQLNTASYVETLLSRYAPESVTGLLNAQKRQRKQSGIEKKREKEEKEEAVTLIEGEENTKHRHRISQNRRNKAAEESVSLYEDLEEPEKPEDLEIEEETVGKGPFARFLMMGFPQGFLTGCIMYLTSYSLMIGHWKIAVGMGGMWVLLMLNFVYMLLHKKEPYALWKTIGLCLVEGYLIETVASLFLSQKMRLYYFIVLGIVTILIQGINIVATLKEKGEDFS